MALDLIAKGEADVGPMLTHHFPFSQVIDAFELQTTRDEGAIKIVVDFP
jgi:L-iditol 2-dehydrogenase